MRKLRKLGSRGNPGIRGNLLAPGAPFALFLLVLVARDASALGFLPEQRVRDATRLDWEFAAGKAARLPAAYHSSKQRYQLFVPPRYAADHSWPLILFLSPGDDPLGWRSFRKPCEEIGCFFAAPYAAGNRTSLAQRVRALLDVLDDVRRSYKIDPERTYLAGLGGAAEIACEVAFALPESFGGVVVLAGDVPLPRLAHLRHRLQDRLSVALVCGKGDPARPRQEKYLAPLLRDLGVRSRSWVVPASGLALPSGEVLGEVRTWLDEDLKRRRSDARMAGLGVEDTPTRRELTARALDRGKAGLRRPDQLHRAAALLEWITARGGKGEAAEKAREALRDLRDDPVGARILQRQSEAELRRWLAARARALEALGELDAARRAWDGVSRLADGPEQKKAEQEVRRLAGLLARRPYLGLTFAGRTTTIKEVAIGGPGDRAGLQAGDVLEQVGKAPVTKLEELRHQVERLRPGDRVRVDVRREGKTVALMVEVGTIPKDE